MQQLRSSDKMEIEKKRKQRPYSEYERTLLMQLVQPNIEILESRKIDSISIRNKAEVWEEISSQFNSSPNITQTADAKQLRKMWQNIKTKARAVRSLEAQRKDTGSVPLRELGSLESQVLAIIPNIRTNGGMSVGKEAINYEKNEEDEDLYWQPKRKRRGSNTEHNYSQEPRDFLLQELDPRFEKDEDASHGKMENFELGLCDKSNPSFEDIKRQLLLHELINNKTRFEKEMKYITNKNELELKHMHEKHQLELEILEIKKMLLVKELKS